MNCQDFVTTWNDWLDQITAENPAPDRSTQPFQALVDHAEGCVPCRELHERHLQFARSLNAWLHEQQASAVTPEFSTRLVQVLLHEQRTPSRRPVAQRGWLRFAAAATVLVAIGGGLARWSPWRLMFDRAGGPAPSHLAAAPTEAQRLERAVSKATQATLELALLSTEPAARVSRSVFQSSAQITDTPLHLTGTLTVPTDPVLSSLEDVGGQISQTVQPISGSARQAFGFLWPIAKPIPNPDPPDPGRLESNVPKTSS